MILNSILYKNYNCYNQIKNNIIIYFFEKNLQIKDLFFKMSNFAIYLKNNSSNLPENVIQLTEKRFPPSYLKILAECYKGCP